MEAHAAAPKPRILLVNEPRSYREALAHVLRALRPGAGVAETEATTLDRELRRGVPQLVICSRATPAVRDAAPAWVELYTDHGALSSVVVGREKTTVSGTDLADILLFVGRALSLVCL